MAKTTSHKPTLTVSLKEILALFFLRLWLFITILLTIRRLHIHHVFLLLLFIIFVINGRTRAPSPVTTVSARGAVALLRRLPVRRGQRIGRRTDVIGLALGSSFTVRSAVSGDAVLACTLGLFSLRQLLMSLRKEEEAVSG